MVWQISVCVSLFSTVPDLLHDGHQWCLQPTILNYNVFSWVPLKCLLFFTPKMTEFVTEVPNGASDADMPRAYSISCPQSLSLLTVQKHTVCSDVSGNIYTWSCIGHYV